MHGWINLDKPLNMTSARAVDAVKYMLKRAGVLGKSKIGHGGTLDPLATGVLPLALGEATKLIPYAMDAAKAYAFTVTWGEERTTDDAEGEIVKKSDKGTSLTEIQAILSKYTGEIEQMPPAFSAIKVDGKRAYDMARAGEVVELKARTVRVDQLAVSSWQLEDSKQAADMPTANCQLLAATTFLCHCGKGTYIRSLARDMGRDLGVFGYVSMLRRVKVGKLNENNAISLDKLEEMVHKGDFGFLRPPQDMLDDILAIPLNAEETAKLKSGQWLSKPTSLHSGTIVACMSGEVLIAMARIDGPFLKAERVFNIL